MTTCSSCGGRTPYCATCADAMFDNLRGAAGARGIGWAQKVAGELGAGAPESWPPYEGKAADIARRKVRGLTGDAALTERLAVVCHQEAARWWERRPR